VSEEQISEYYEVGILTTQFRFILSWNWNLINIHIGWIVHSLFYRILLWFMLKEILAHGKLLLLMISSLNGI